MAMGSKMWAPVQKIAKKCINAMKIEKPSDFSSKVAEDDKKRYEKTIFSEFKSIFLISQIFR